MRGRFELRISERPRKARNAFVAFVSFPTLRSIPDRGLLALSHTNLGLLSLAQGEFEQGSKGAGEQD